jgi:hypothetical protein
VVPSGGRSDKVVTPGRVMSAVRELRRTVAAAHRSAAAALRYDRWLARVGVGLAGQIAALPRDISALVPHVRVVPTEAIRWGGRPPGPHRPKGLIVMPAGEWDLQCKQPIDDYLSADAYGSSIHELFVEGTPYTETAQYAQMLDRLARGERPKHFTSVAEVDSYFHRLNEAYASIAAHGYRSQAELGTGTEDDEIRVYVDRNGELHKQWGSGHHRLAIARLLGIENVPVCIGGVHRQWVERCHARFGGDVISALRRGIDEDISPLVIRC